MTIFENVLVAVEQGVRRKSSSWWRLIDKSYCVARTEELVRSVGLAASVFHRLLRICRSTSDVAWRLLVAWPWSPRVLLVDEPADGMAATQQERVGEACLEGSLWQRS